MSRRLADLGDWVPGAHRPRPVRAGVAALVVIALLLVVAYAGWRPWAGTGQKVRVQLATAEQLTPGRTPVRVAGVQVGHVSAIEASPDGRGAVAVLALTDDKLHVKRDARAKVRLRTLVGGTRYVGLDPGSAGAPDLGDAVLPLSRTSSQVDWDDVNQIFEPDVRISQRRSLTGLRQGLADPAGAGRTIDRLGPALDTLGRSAGAARGEREGDLRRLVHATARATDALSRHPRALEGLVHSGARALAVTDGHRAALGAAMRLSPPALDATRTTMRRLDTTLGHLDPLAAELRPGARRLGPAVTALRPALRETQALLHRAVPLLRALPPALRDLAGAGREGVPLLAGLDPTLRRLDDNLLPWLASRDPDTKLRNFEAIGPTFSVLTSAAGDYDAMGYFLHFPLTPAGDSAVLPCGPGLEPGTLTRCKAVDGVFKAILGGEKKRP